MSRREAPLAETAQQLDGDGAPRRRRPLRPVAENARYAPIPETVAIYGGSRSAIYRDAAKGIIRLVKAGRSTLVDLESVRAARANARVA